MSEKEYDYCIAGAGAAGLHLALAMAKEDYFNDKQILILDKSKKTENDRTWCFWEKGEGKWDNIIDHKWSTGKFLSTNDALTLQLEPYSYKKLRGISFYNHAKELISQRDNIEWITEGVNNVKEMNDQVEVSGETNTYLVSHCFDSRINKDFDQSDDRYIRILQHFKGWTISFEKDVFDPNSFTMMDFRIKHENSTSFSYVLPVSSREALVEFTLFTKYLLPENDYDPYIKEYISTYISKEEYSIKEVEFGVIPMSNYPFHKVNSERITKIGTAGSWVRPSSGYSFKYSEKYVQKLIENIKAGRRPDKNLISSKYRFYDTLLLDILYGKNNLGPGIFYQMYSKNPVQLIFKFLDGETTIAQDVKIISSLDALPFLQALVRQIK